MLHPRLSRSMEVVHHVVLGVCHRFYIQEQLLDVEMEEVGVVDCGWS